MKCIVSSYGFALETSIASFGERPTPMWTDSIESPSFVAANGEWLFAITENRDYAGLYAYRQETVGTYRMTDRRSFDGSKLCHIAYSPKNRLVLGACYGSGTIVYAGFDPQNGTFAQVHSIAQTGEGKVSRAHCVLLNRAEDLVFTANAGLDEVTVYRIQDGGLLEANRIATRPGSAPRHLRLSADEKRLYVITENTNELLVYDTQCWQLMQAVSTLPARFVGACHCSSFCLTPDERFLYAANRSVDTISVFAVDDRGLLTLQGSFDCGGRNPRHIELSPDGTQLVICCQESNWVVFKRLHPETGMATHTVREISFNAPSCVALEP